MNPYDVHRNRFSLANAQEGVTDADVMGALNMSNLKLRHTMHRRSTTHKRFLLGGVG
jgi:hypothetical protein